MAKKYKVKEKCERNTLDGVESDSRIFAQYRTLDKPIKTHWHTYFELEIIVGGRAKHTINGESFYEESGSVYLLSPTDFHSVEPSEPLTLYNLSFAETAISNKRLCELLAEGMTKRFTLDDDGLSRVLSLIKLCDAESKEKDGGCCRELCDGLLTVLMRYVKSVNTGGILPEQASGIKKALLYLDVHFRENPSLGDVAKQAGFHKNYFSELFKRVTGESYTQRLNTLKINYAKMLLRGGFSVTETCFNSGFGSLSNFLATFKKRVGVCPEDFKRDEIR